MYNFMHHSTESVVTIKRSFRSQTEAVVEALGATKPEMLFV